jgi:hypothetical protein
VDEDEAVAFPEDLSGLSSEEISALDSQAVAEFDSLMAHENVTSADIERLTALADGLEMLRAEADNRLTMASQKDGLKDRLSKIKALPTSPDGGDDGDDDTEDAPPAAKAPEKTPVAAKTQTIGTSITAADETDEPEVPKQKVRPSLEVAQQNAPQVPDRSAASALTIVAAAPSSGVSIGQNISSLDQLTAAVQSASRGMVTTHGQPAFLPIATISNDYEFVIDGERTDEREFEAMAKMLRSPERAEAIVAGGGWCAPSETRYDFFNISCQDGMIDLPTFGVKRGGVRFPVSPSLADVFTGTFTNATNPWLWTEADDILTVTGSTNKPCVRVPCATMSEMRLDCYGICLTAGNLTDNAWPEATRNYLKLLMSAHYHASNQRYITQMVALSSSINIITTGSGGEAISADAPDYVALAAVDYRERYGLCENDVLEVVFPRWLKEAIRSDLGRRTGVDFLNVTDAMINALFRVRNVRVQWVSDWQVRTTGQPGGSSALSAWPDTVDFMIYAAGTFMLGNGMTLDLGVVRDSVLNAENDHTAAWMEECHLIAKFGYESRQYRIPVCAAGRTGSANITNCHVL